MKEIKGKYTAGGQRPMKALRRMVKEAGMLLPLGPKIAGREKQVRR